MSAELDHLPLLHLHLMGSVSDREPRMVLRRVGDSSPEEVSEEVLGRGGSTIESRGLKAPGRATLEAGANGDFDTTCRTWAPLATPPSFDLLYKPLGVSIVTHILNSVVSH
ncbi:UNVERIFIED_CONTAM: hypothetical protein Sradi_6653200 [Sesamum radiatum]|uniref:Uncharacterized protein n=1 Tax=Sesamum radiatum TaxID=300843 RepID=A0AAW2JMX0_SESRA